LIIKFNWREIIFQNQSEIVEIAHFFTFIAISSTMSGRSRQKQKAAQVEEEAVEEQQVEQEQQQEEQQEQQQDEQQEELSVARLINQLEVRQLLLLLLSQR
jgi:hypothetical protein